MFFFWGEEWIRFRQTQTMLVTVPSDAMRRGDFSELLDPANRYFGRVRQIIDRQTGRPFLDNVVPDGPVARRGKTGFPPSDRSNRSRAAPQSY
jgi:hypothetical protein